MKSFSELSKLTTFEERLEYLRTDSPIGEDTFGSRRYLNQKFYNSAAWKKARRDVIVRDMGCDMGLAGHEIPGKIVIHHINPIAYEDLANFSSKALDMENLVCVSNDTHQMIHWSADKADDPYTLTERKPGDTTLWKTQSLTM